MATAMRRLSPVICGCLFLAPPPFRGTRPPPSLSSSASRHSSSWPSSPLPPTPTSPQVWTIVESTSWAYIDWLWPLGGSNKLGDERSLGHNEAFASCFYLADSAQGKFCGLLASHLISTDAVDFWMDAISTNGKKNLETYRIKL